MSSKRLLALCSAAVLCTSTYGCSVESTQAQTPTSKTTAVKSAAHTSVTKKTVKRVTKPAMKQKYKDGTYTGVGSTNIGAVQVSVTLKKDKITACKITGYSTHYPISYIDPVLPQELLARQNINKVDVVTGATLSTYDFYSAVSSCLQQAQKAESSSNHRTNA